MELDDDAGNPNFVVEAGDDDDSSSEESVQNKNMRQVCLLTCVVRTNKVDGLGGGIVLPNANAVALVTVGAVELQALTFFASRSVVYTD
jgi:hypothetical protein